MRKHLFLYSREQNINNHLMEILPVLNTPCILNVLFSMECWFCALLTLQDIKLWLYFCDIYIYCMVTLNRTCKAQKQLPLRQNIVKYNVECTHTSGLKLAHCSCAGLAGMECELLPGSSFFWVQPYMTEVRYCCSGYCCSGATWASVFQVGYNCIVYPSPCIFFFCYYCCCLSLPLLLY